MPPRAISPRAGSGPRPRASRASRSDRAGPAWRPSAGRRGAGRGGPARSTDPGPSGRPRPARPVLGTGAGSTVARDRREIHAQAQAEQAVRAEVRPAHSPAAGHRNRGMSRPWPSSRGIPSRNAIDPDGALTMDLRSSPADVSSPSAFFATLAGRSVCRVSSRRAMIAGATAGPAEIGPGGLAGCGRDGTATEGLAGHPADRTRSSQASEWKMNSRCVPIRPRRPHSAPFPFGRQLPPIRPAADPTPAAHLRCRSWCGRRSDGSANERRAGPGRGPLPEGRTPMQPPDRARYRRMTRGRGTLRQGRNIVFSGGSTVDRR